MGKKNLEESAYQAIMESILDHRFKPGDLILETELTERLGMRSRTPVRHALAQLEAKGFLEKRPKRGYIIPLPNRQDARHVFFARMHIEGVNAACVANSRTREDIEHLSDMIALEEKTGLAREKTVYSGINENFHLALARMGGNPYLLQYSRHLFWRSSYYIFYFGSYYTEKEDYVRHMLAPTEHQAILEAIREGDGPKAEALMREHIRTTCEKIVEKIVY